MAGNRHAGPSWALPLLLLAIQGEVWAADWQIQPRISLSERYSDNIELRANGLEHSDWVTTITPGISLNRNGRRLQVHADYSLMGMLYADDGDRSRARHNLYGRANAELLEDWLFLDASTRVSQELKDYTQGIGMGDAVGLGNTSQVSSLSLSPYLKHRFGSFATVEARITREGVWTDSANASDSDSTQYHLTAGSGTEFLPLAWSARYDRRKTDNRRVANADSESGSVNFRLPMSRRYGLLAQAGMEKNNYPGVRNRVRDFSYYGVGAFYTPGRRFSADLYYNDSDSGGFASGNIAYTPTERTTIHASSTQRNFGRSYALDLSHRTRKTHWGLMYSESISSFSQGFTSPGFNVWLCDSSARADLSALGFTWPGNGTVALLRNAPLVPPPPGCIRFFRESTTSVVPYEYLSKALTGSFNYRFRRSDLHVTLYQHERDYSSVAPIGGDRSEGMQVSWSLTPGARTTFTLSGGLSRIDTGVAGVGDDELWNVRLLATRRIQPKVSGSVEARHQERTSSRANGGYSENSVAATLNMSF